MKESIAVINQISKGIDQAEEAMKDRKLFQQYIDVLISYLTMVKNSDAQWTMINSIGKVYIKIARAMVSVAPVVIGAAISVGAAVESAASELETPEFKAAEKTATHEVKAWVGSAKVKALYKRLMSFFS